MKGKGEGNSRSRSASKSNLSNYFSEKKRSSQGHEFQSVKDEDLFRELFGVRNIMESVSKGVKLYVSTAALRRVREIGVDA